MAKKRKRIPIDEAPTALNNAFGDLPTEGLRLPPDPVVEEKPATPEPSGLPKTLILRRETAHRGGKAVVIVYDFPRTFSNAAIHDLGRELKQSCGCGGSVKQREVMIQGEKVSEVRAFLEERGVNVRGEK